MFVHIFFKLNISHHFKAQKNLCQTPNLQSNYTVTGGNLHVLRQSHGQTPAVLFQFYNINE